MSRKSIASSGSSSKFFIWESEQRNDSLGTDLIQHPNRWTVELCHGSITVALPSAWHLNCIQSLQEGITCDGLTMSDKNQDASRCYISRVHWHGFTLFLLHDSFCVRRIVTKERLQFVTPWPELDLSILEKRNELRPSQLTAPMEGRREAFTPKANRHVKHPGCRQFLCCSAV